MRAHFSAFRSRLEAHPALAGKVETAVRITNGTPVRANYAVAFPGAPDKLGDDRYRAIQQRDSDAVYTNDVRLVATSADGVLTLADAALDQMIGHSLAVEGRRCDPIRLVEGVEEGRVEYDRQSNLYYLDLSFRYRSRRP